MTQEDIELFTQYETAVRQYTESKKAEWILNGGIEKNGILILMRWKN